MTGEKLTLGVVAALAVAGAARQGSPNTAWWSRYLQAVKQHPMRPEVFTDEGKTSEDGTSALLVEDGEITAGATLTVERGKTVYIAWIQALEKGSGEGTRLLKVLTDAADQTGLKLALVPNTLRLCLYYRRHGFYPDGKPELPCTDMVWMVRHPKRTTA